MFVHDISIKGNTLTMADKTFCVVEPYLSFPFRFE